jgi:hypothetical protein
VYIFPFSQIVRHDCKKNRIKMFFEVWKVNEKLFSGWVLFVYDTMRVDGERWQKNLGLSQEIWQEMLRKEGKSWQDFCNGRIFCVVFACVETARRLCAVGIFVVKSRDAWMEKKLEMMMKNYFKIFFIILLGFEPNFSCIEIF